MAARSLGGVPCRQHRPVILPLPARQREGVTGPADEGGFGPANAREGAAADPPPGSVGGGECGQRPDRPANATPDIMTRTATSTGLSRLKKFGVGMAFWICSSVRSDFEAAR